MYSIVVDKNGISSQDINWKTKNEKIDKSEFSHAILQDLTLANFLHTHIKVLVINGGMTNKPNQACHKL